MLTEHVIGASGSVEDITNLDRPPSSPADPQTSMPGTESSCSTAPTEEILVLVKETFMPSFPGLRILRNIRTSCKPECKSGTRLGRLTAAFKRATLKDYLKIIIVIIVFVASTVLGVPFM